MLKSRKAKIFAIFLAIVLVITGTNIVAAFADETDSSDYAAIGGSNQAELGESGQLALGASVARTPFAINDVTVAISNNAPASGYQTYTNSAGVTPPALVTNISVSIKKANIQNGKIELNFASTKGYLNTDFFTYDKISAIPASSIFAGAPTVDAGTGKITLTLKDNVAINSSESISIYHNYNTAQYDGAAPPQTTLATISAKAIVGTETVYTSQPFSVKSQSSSYPSLSVEYFFPTSAGTSAAPAEVLNDDTLLIRQRVNNNDGHYKNKFDPSEPVQVKLYHPNGTTGHDIVQNVTVGAAEAANAGIPVGTYAVKTRTLANNGQWSNFNFLGNLNDNFDQLDFSFVLPPNSNGQQFALYRTLSYKHLGASSVTYKTSTQHIKVNDSRGWDLYLKDTNSTGSANNGYSEMENGNVGNDSYKTGFGYTHGSSSRNQGSVNTTGVEFNLYQAGTSPKRINYNNITFYADKKNSSSPDVAIKYWFVIASDKGHADFTTSETKTAYSANFTLNLPTLDPAKGQYIKETHVVPIAKVGVIDTEGIWPPGISYRLTYITRAWNNKLWPDGTAITNGIHSVPVAYKINYINATTSKPAVFQGSTAYPSYISGTPRPEMRGGAKPGTSPGSVEPGDSIVYRLNGLNSTVFSTRTWDDPVMIVRFPSGITIENTSNLRFMDASGVDQGQAVVTASGEVNGSYYYRIQSPNGYKVARGNSTAFYIDVPLKLPAGIDQGLYQPEFVLTEKDSANYFSTSMPAVPAGQTIADYGLAATEKYTYFKDGSQASLGVIGSEKMSSNSKIKSAATGGAWDTAETVAADFDETVSVQLNVINEGNKPLGAFKLYDIIPYGSYLGSSATCKITLENVNAPGGTVWYYTAAGPASLEDIQTINTSGAGWTKTKPADTSTIKAFLVDFGAMKLAGGKTLTAELSFKVPSKSAGEQLAFNQFSYTTGAANADGTVPTINTYVNPKQGFSTSSYSIRYIKSFENEVENWPDNQSGILMGTSADKLLVTSQEPTRVGYTFKEWNTQADGKGTTWNKGATKSFNVNDTKLELHDIWIVDTNKKISVTYKLAGGNVAGSKADVVQTGKVAENTLTFPAVTRAGYILDGFYKDVTNPTTKWNTTDKITSADIVANGITLTAKWTTDNTQKVLVKYTTVDVGNVTGMPASTAKYAVGEKIPTPTNPVRPGYTLTGWKYGGSNWNFTTAIDDIHFGGTAPNYEMTLEAVWAVNPAQTISVTYDLAKGNVGGSTANVVQTGKKAEDTLTPPTPVRSGYKLDGWKNGATVWNAGDKLTSAHIGAGSLTLTAQWSVDSTKSVTINYTTTDTGNVTGMPAAVTSNAGQPIAKPADPVRSGYKLTGWNYKGAPWAFTTLLDETHFGATAPYTMTLEAVWEVDTNKTINITYDLKGGNISGNTTNPTENNKTVESTLSLPTPSKAGYTFAGWYNGATKWNAADKLTSAHMKAGSLTLDAKWTIDATQTISVTYDLDKGNVSGSTANIVQTGKKVEDTLTLPTPVRSGYKLDGWYNGATVWNAGDKLTSAHIAAGALTLKAKWSVDSTKNLTVNYTTTDTLNVTGMPTAVTRNAGQPIAKPADPVRSGYKLTGWNYKGAPWVFTTLLDETHFGATAPYTMTLEAVWEVDAAQTINITYDLKGGNVGGNTVNPTENNKTVESTLSLPAPSRAGYTFGGWYNGATKWNAADKLTSAHMKAGSLTLTAKWAVDGTATVDVTFALNGGKIGSDTTDKADLGKKVEDTLVFPTQPTRAGYSFDGWFKDITDISTKWNATDKVTSADIAGGDFTLTAKWSIDSSQKVKVSFTTDDTANVVSLPSDQLIIAGQKIAEPSAPTRAGYTLKGWNYGILAWDFDTVLDTEHFGGTAPNYTMTLKAVWAINNGVDTSTDERIDVVFDLDGGNIAGSTANPTDLGKHVEDTLSIPANPTKAGYTFSGWYDGTTLWTPTSKINSAHMSAGALTLKAKWTVDATQVLTVNFTTDDSINVVGMPASVTKNAGDKISKPSNPTRAGYSLKTWNYNSAEWNFATALDATHFGGTAPNYTMTLKALWKVDNSQNINATFKLNGGNIAGSTADVTDNGKHVEDKLTMPSNPTRTGYVFAGWYKDISDDSTVWAANDKITSVEMAAGSITLTAKWDKDNAQKVTVKFATVDDTNVTGMPDEVRKAVGETIAEPTKPTRAGYSLTDWTYGGTSWNFGTEIDTVHFGTTVPYTMTLNAVWSINNGTGTLPDERITATFDLNGGNIAGSTVNPTDIGKHVEDTLTFPANPTRIGYTFNGWYENVDVAATKWTAATKINSAHMKAGALTLKAKWDVNTSETLTVKYATVDAGNVTGMPANETRYAGQTITSPTAPVRAGYKLTGWNYGGSVWNFGTKLDTVHFGTVTPYEMTLNAVWEIDPSQSINVTFDLNGGRVGGSQANIVEANRKVEDGLTLHTPIKEGYAFEGWYKDITNPATQWIVSDKITAVHIKNGNFTLKAKWSIDPTQAIDITLDLNGGNIGGSTVNPVLAAKNVEDTVTLPAPVREGYTFLGWFLGNTKWTTGTTLVPEHMALGDFTLTANWKINQYTVTFDSNGGIATGNITGDYNSKVKLPVVTRLAYVLDGWYNAADVKVGTAGQDYTITKNETLKAKWLKVTYTLVYDKDVVVDVDDKYPAKSNALTIEDFLKAANVSTTSSVGTKAKAMLFSNPLIEGEPKITSPDLQNLNYSQVTGAYNQTVTLKFEWVTGQVETITMGVKVADRTAPVISLNDKQRFEINIVDKKGAPNNEAELLAYMMANGLKVIDNYDGELTPIISYADGSFASINWNEPEEYGIFIDAVDSSGNKAGNSKAAVAVVTINTNPGGSSGDGGGTGGGNGNNPDKDSNPNIGGNGNGNTGSGNTNTGSGSGNGSSNGKIPQTGGGEGSTNSPGGNSFDSNGNLVDANGNKLVNKEDLPKGSKINEAGQLIDSKGNLINLDGLAGGKLPTTGIVAGGSSIGLIAIASLILLAKKKKNKEDEHQL